MGDIFLVSSLDSKSIKSAKLIQCPESDKIGKNENDKCSNIEHGHIDSGVNKQELGLKWSQSTIPLSEDQEGAHCSLLNF